MERLCCIRCGMYEAMQYSGSKCVSMGADKLQRWNGAPTWTTQAEISDDES